MLTVMPVLGNVLRKFCDSTRKLLHTMCKLQLIGMDSIGLLLPLHLVVPPMTLMYVLAEFFDAGLMPVRLVCKSILNATHFLLKVPPHLLHHVIMMRPLCIVQFPSRVMARPQQLLNAILKLPQGLTGLSVSTHSSTSCLQCLNTQSLPFNIAAKASYTTLTSAHVLLQLRTSPLVFDHELVQLSYTSSARADDLLEAGCAVL
mmetsp:Transcript_24927/g.45779  ORF Transcript_24927/g.45779 Transcript_24927/m.45779 type:complete len:203 (+) Transcript_24927:959-1567(+)